MNSRNAASVLLPAKSPGDTTCILSEAPKANAPSDVHSAARNELKGKVEPDTMQKDTVRRPVAMQNTRYKSMILT